MQKIVIPSSFEDFFGSEFRQRKVVKVGCLGYFYLIEVKRAEVKVPLSSKVVVRPRRVTMVCYPLDEHYNEVFEEEGTVKKYFQEKGLIIVEKTVNVESADIANFEPKSMVDFYCGDLLVGSFKVIDRKERSRIRKGTGEEYVIPARRALLLKQSVDFGQKLIEEGYEGYANLKFNPLYF